MSVLKWPALLVTGLALAGCCTSTTGCYAPPPAGVPMAWDGAGTRPSENARPIKRAHRAKTEIVLGPLNAVAPVPTAVQSNPADAYAQQQSEEAVAEQNLKQRLVICSTCLAQTPAGKTPSAPN